MFKIGDRVVDRYVEERYGKMWAGTVMGVSNGRIVQVHWDMDEDHWVDTAYDIELRKINA
jgi:hypothetical protein